MSLEIDFAPNSNPRSPLRMGIGSITLALILGFAWSLTSKTEAGLPSNDSLMPTAEDVHSINGAIDELNFPWLALLKSIEGSGEDSIRYLHLDADAHDLRMTIQGEARNGKVVLELPERLRSSPVIADARVVSQTPSSNADARKFPLRFALEVTIRAPEGEKP